MRLQKLIIHNIASIEDAVIDFERQPLSDSEVFLITGKTGAGKSTILDAICLTLYADTPRLDNTKMQGATTDGDKSVKINDPRQLMRRNTSEAYTKLTFIGSNNVHYEATWSVTRARKKVNGNIQTKEWELRNLDENISYTKDKEIEAEIMLAVGLDFSHFCRTTILAQGEFTRFLNSKDDEKAEILEKITGVDSYSRIGAKIYAITSQKEQAWKEAMRLAEGTYTLTDEQIEERMSRLAELDKEYNDLKGLCDQDIIKRDWIRKDNELKCNVQETQNALMKAQEVLMTDDFKSKERTVREWNETIDARLWLNEAKNAEREQTRHKETLRELEKQFQVLLGGLRYEEKEKDRKQNELSDIDSFLAKENDKTYIYEQAQTICGLLSNVDEARSDIEKNKKIAEKENATLNEILMPSFKKAEKDVCDNKLSFETEGKELSKLESELNEMRMQELREKRDAAKERLNNVNTARERINHLNDAKSQYDKKRNSLAERDNATQEKMKRLKSLEAPVLEATQQVRIRKEILDKQKDTVDKFATALRMRLQPGDTCPVCRQRIETPLPHEDELAMLVNGLREDYEKAEAELKELTDNMTRLEAEVKTENDAYVRDLRLLENDDTVHVATLRALEACLACGLNGLDDTSMTALDSLEKATREDKDNLENWIKKGEQIEMSVTNARKECENRRKLLDEAESRLREAEKNVTDCQTRLATATALVKAKKNDAAAALQKTHELLGEKKWDINWNESPKEFARFLNDAAKMYAEMSQRRLSLTALLQTMNAKRENVKSVVNSIIEVMPDWKSIQAASETEVDDILARANSIANNTVVTINNLTAAGKRIDDNRTKLKAFMCDNDNMTTERLECLCTLSANDITTMDNELKRDRDTVIAKKTLFDNANKMTTTHQNSKPDMNEDDTLESLINRIGDNEKSQKEIGENKGAINQELKNDRENKIRLKSLIEDADNKKKEYQKWYRLNYLIGDSTGNKFRKIAQSYVLTSLVQSANHYMRTLTDRYTLKVAPGTFIIQLEDAYQGFVSRAASTISGGESFLVSLALALALSDIGHNLSVDTIFIDEGFGTLSGEPLQNAITTLRSLHSKAGRHVGIISHVEELRERIPVQIQVIQEGNNSSSRIRIIPET